MRKILVVVVTAIVIVIAGTTEAANWQWWRLGAVTPIAAWQAVGATDLATSYVDLTGNGNTLSPGIIEPDFTENGWGFDTAFDYLQWLDTGITPTDEYSVFALVDDGFALTVAGESGGMIVSLGNGADLFEHERIYGMYAGGERYGASVVMGLAGNQPYWNARPDGGSVAYASHENLFIGAVDAGGEGILVCTCTVQAVAIYDRVLTRAQVSQLTRNMLWLPDTPPREVTDAVAYSVDLPSGQTGSVLMSATAGDGLITSIVGVLLVVAVFQELRTMAHKSSG